MSKLNSPFDKKETAGINSTSNIVDASLCPVCNKVMETILVEDIPSVACLQHRICLPKKDKTVAGQE